MKAIIISEEELEKILKETCEKLDLTEFRIQCGPAKITMITVEDMHRRFNYWLCDMVNRIKDAK